MSIAARILLFTALVPGSVAGWIPFWILWQRGQLALPPPAGGSVPGLAVFALGAGVYARCALDFGRAQGTPAPIDPPKELVVRGLYRFSRNPMYVGVLGMIAGEALLFRSTALAAYGLAVFGLFHAFVVLYEEPTLERAFGAAYAAFRERTPRWLGWARPARP